MGSNLSFGFVLRVSLGFPFDSLSATSDKFRTAIPFLSFFGWEASFELAYATFWTSTNSLSSDFEVEGPAHSSCS